MEANGTINFGNLSPYNEPQTPSNFSLEYDDFPSVDEIENILSMTEDVADAAHGTSLLTPPTSSPANADVSNGISIPMQLPSSPANMVVSPVRADATNGVVFQVSPATSFGTNMAQSPQNANVANGMPPASSCSTNFALSPGYADISNGIPFRMPPTSSSGTMVRSSAGNAGIMVNGISFPMTAANMAPSLVNTDVTNRNSLPIPQASSPANVGFPPVSFGATNGTTSDMTPLPSSSANTVLSSMNVNMSTRFSFGTNGISLAIPSDISPANMALSPVRRLVHGPAWSIDWSRQEQATLNRGLLEFASDPVVTKYAKIAARLPSKTVRDVAMRCYWMKKREHERRQRAECIHLGRSMAEREERLASSSRGAHNHQLIQSASPSSQPMIHDMHTNQNPERSASSSLGVQNNQQSAGPISQSVMHNFPSNQYEQTSSEVWRLLEENNVILAHIAGNIGTDQMQHNGGLFNLVGSTIGTMLLGMDGANGGSINMPPLPVSMNVDLFNAMWPNFPSPENAPSDPNLAEVPRTQSG